jgi:hypothetical protein
MEKFTEDWYDKCYFADKKGKAFKRPNGSTEHWGYRNPDGDIKGADQIIKAWKTMFNPQNLLDVGCGRGPIVAYARNIGIEAFGFDWSKWAINEGRFARCKSEWLRCHDATKPWPYPNNSFDLLIALDFWEHIYVEDLDFVISEMFRVAHKWIFLEIAIAGSGGLQGRVEEGYVLKKGAPIPIELEGCAVAGHVTVRKESWWLDKFERDEWQVRRDMVNWFYSLLAPLSIKNWLLNLVLILERIE